MRKLTITALLLTALYGCNGDPRTPHYNKPPKRYKYSLGIDSQKGFIWREVDSVWIDGNGQYRAYKDGKLTYIHTDKNIIIEPNEN